MTPAIQSAASAIQAEQTRFDVSANNVANVNTTAFRPSTVQTSAQAGGGVAVAGATRSTTQGALARTGNPTDVAISGSGYFRIQVSSGETQYTRNGSFSVDANGYLRSGGGYLLGVGGAIRVPSNPDSISISDGGTVSYVDSAGIPTVAGTINVAQFSNEQGLISQTGTTFSESAASGPPQVSIPGQNGAGTLATGAVEVSGTDFVAETVTSILTQRSVEANSATIRTSDEMMRTLMGIKT